MEDRNPIPMLADVDTVRLAITCESIIDERRGDDAEDYARVALKHYASRITDVIGTEHVDVGEEVEDSEYDSAWRAFHMSCFIDVTPEQWRDIADGFCMDLDWSEWSDDEYARTGRGRHKLDDMAHIPALPNRGLVDTMGILGADGITPAVAIEGTDEGWGDYSGEPILCASFYVALLLKSDEDN